MLLFNLADFFPNLADFFLNNAVPNAYTAITFFPHINWMYMQSIELYLCIIRQNVGD